MHFKLFLSNLKSYSLETGSMKCFMAFFVCVFLFQIYTRPFPTEQKQQQKKQAELQIKSRLQVPVPCRSVRRVGCNAHCYVSNYLIIHTLKNISILFPNRPRECGAVKICRRDIPHSTSSRFAPPACVCVCVCPHGKYTLSLSSKATFSYGTGISGNISRNLWEFVEKSRRGFQRPVFIFAIGFLRHHSVDEWKTGIF